MYVKSKITEKYIYCHRNSTIENKTVYVNGGGGNKKYHIFMKFFYINLNDALWEKWHVYYVIIKYNGMINIL